LQQKQLQAFNKKVNCFMQLYNKPYVILEAYHRRFPLKEVEYRRWRRTFWYSQCYIIYGWCKWTHITHRWNKSLKNNTDIHYIPKAAWGHWCLIDPWKQSMQSEPLLYFIHLTNNYFECNKGKAWGVSLHSASSFQFFICLWTN